MDDFRVIHTGGLKWMRLGLPCPIAAGFTGNHYSIHRGKGHMLTRFSMEHWNSLIFFKVSLSRFTSLMYMAKSWKSRQGQCTKSHRG